MGPMSYWDREEFQNKRVIIIKLYIKPFDVKQMSQACEMLCEFSCMKNAAIGWKNVTLDYIVPDAVYLYWLQKAQHTDVLLLQSRFLNWANLFLILIKLSQITNDLP